MQVEFDSVVRGQRVFNSETRELEPASLFIKDGKIVRRTGLDESKDVDPAKVIDAADQVVLPGVVDSHVHVNDPGRSEWETFPTATQAAARGGVTTIADMPLNSIPSTVTVDALHVKQRVARKRCWTDVRFIGGVVAENLAHVKPLVHDGVCAFKCFLLHSGVDEFTWVTEEQAESALKEIGVAVKELEAKQGDSDVHKPCLMFHAELDIELESPSDDPSEYNTFLKSRPKEMEDRAIEKVINLCRRTRIPCHIVHLSSSQSIAQIAAAKEEGLPITVETCFHYLFFQSESIPRNEPKFKCCPPIREASNSEKLWKALLDGVIDLVVSDHSPCTESLKQGNYMEAWGGISSIQYGLSILSTVAHKYGLETKDYLPLIVRWMCENPAKLIGLSNKKGKLLPGYDADFVIFSPEETFCVKRDEILFKNKISAYEDHELRGAVSKTILRGQVIVDGGRLIEFDKGPGLLL